MVQKMLQINRRNDKNLIEHSSKPITIFCRATDFILPKSNDPTIKVCRLKWNIITEIERINYAFDGYLVRSIQGKTSK